MKKRNIKIPQELKEVLKALQKEGIKPIFVGGFVRDLFLQIPSKDYDIELYGSNDIEKIQKILKKYGQVLEVGKSFSVLKLKLNNNEVDFSLPRIEKKVEAGHRGFEVVSNGFMKYKKAFKRRDFTINAIGYDYASAKYIDPFGGIDDIKNRRLRVVDKRSFIEDPLRVYRAMQFCARFNLKVDKKSIKLCKEIVKSGEVQTISHQRVCIEFEKLFSKAKKPSRGFDFLKRVKAVSYFEELANIEENKFKAILKAMDFVAKSVNNTKRVYLTLCAICCNLRKDDCESFLHKVSNKNSLIKDVEKFSKIYFENSYKSFKNFSDFDIKLFAKDMSTEDFCLVYMAHNQKNKKDIYTFKKRAKKLNVLNKPILPIVTGADLIAIGLKPSKSFANILQKAYILQLQNDEFAKDDILNSIKK